MRATLGGVHRQGELLKVTVYTDGACRRNPGPGGWGSFAALDAPRGASVACALCAFEDESIAEGMVRDALALAG